ncbi:hypothetical protein IEO21_07875 [Rhodonia placenta]|uniref:Uncharacterized protein n=1 Tax=Rhodonia placenta TaxID=104341 RepID=A0A8H7NX91_9APHY|nr:hypothetical protein IEO21_07875 [Postia placenta]
MQGIRSSCVSLRLGAYWSTYAVHRVSSPRNLKSSAQLFLVLITTLYKYWHSSRRGEATRSAAEFKRYVRPFDGRCHLSRRNRYLCRFQRPIDVVSRHAASQKTSFTSSYESIEAKRCIRIMPIGQGTSLSSSWGENNSPS